MRDDTERYGNIQRTSLNTENMLDNNGKHTWKQMKHVKKWTHTEKNQENNIDGISLFWQKEQKLQSYMMLS